MIYRKAIESDQPTLKRFEADGVALSPEGYFWRAGDGMLGVILEWDWMFVAEDDGEVVGMLGAVPTNSYYWYVAEFYVAPGVRGKGVGRGLMNAAAEFHATLGRKAALATPIPTAIEAYERLGFKAVTQTMEWVCA